MEQNQGKDQLKIKYFKTFRFFFYEWNEGEKFQDIFKKYGFHQKHTFESYTFNDSSPFLEIYWYENEKKESIILVWDKNTEIFQFFCEDPNQTLECLNHCLNFCNKTLDFEIKRRRIDNMKV